MSEINSTDGLSRWRFCKRCGSRIPSSAEACLHCGVAPEVITSPSISSSPVLGLGLHKLILEEGKKIRLGFFFLSLAIFVISMFLGTKAQVSPGEALRIMEEYMAWETGFEFTALNIAVNNARPCFLFSIPILGTPLMAFASYSSGVFISVVASQYFINPQQLFVTNLLYPWVWLEFTAYSLASTHGIMFLLGFLTRRWKEEGKNFLIAMGVSLILIGISAVAEAQMMASIL